MNHPATLPGTQHVKVNIKGEGEVRALLIQRYLDGDWRVDYDRKMFIVSPANQIKEY